jgi:hypothetical protein
MDSNGGGAAQARETGTLGKLMVLLDLVTHADAPLRFTDILALAGQPRGTLHRLTVESNVLKGNLLGDPTEREVHVYVSAGHDGHGLPLLVDLVDAGIIRLLDLAFLTRVATQERVGQGDPVGNRIGRPS